jgi:hypothetical protein
LLAVERIDVADAYLEARVRVKDPTRVRTSAVPGLPELALGALPGLARHSCENEAGARFVDELADTEVPHLLEHVTVELMALAGSPRSLKARTFWDFARDGRNVFRVRVSFDDDGIALGAFDEAVCLTEALMGGGPVPDADAVARGAHSLRR